MPKPSKLGAEKLMPDDGLTQSERFIKAAQELGTDNDPERFVERVKKLARASKIPHAAQSKEDS